MQGKIIKGIAGFYYVSVLESGIYECKAKGIFRKDGRKPLVGDDVEISILDEEIKEGNIVELLPRKNELIRPAVANIDGSLIVMAFTAPKPNRRLLDSFLIMMGQKKIPAAVCFNKQDLLGESREEALEMKRAYELAGYPVFCMSVAGGSGLDEVREYIKGRTVTVAGPSGVGKSSLINALQRNVHMDTGTISKKVDRGKHTTRHSELIPVGEGTFICDTPGFSSLSLMGLEYRDLWRYFPEFIPCEGNCRFQGCLHAAEPDCGVKDGVSHGIIAKSRYDSYIGLLEELKSRKRY